MKRNFYIGLAVILLLSVSVILYGTYLNSRGENIIATRMDNRSLTLKGQKAKVREIYPVLVLDTVNLYSDDMADAVALIDGRIIESYAERNSEVKKGDKLFSLINEEIPLKIMQAESSILKAEAELKRAKNTFDRYSRLIEVHAVSLEKLEEAEAGYRAAEASVEELNAQKQLMIVQQSRQSVTAPIDGEVLLLYRQPGSYVSAGTALALIGNFKRLCFSQTMNDREISKFSVGSELQAKFQVSDMQKVYDTEYAAGNKGTAQSFKARIIEVNPSLSEPAAVRKVLLEIDNTARLLEPQSYRGVKLQSNRSLKCLTVPLAAFLNKERNSLFVLSADKTLQRRQVVVGVNDGKYAEIVRGLKEGDIVITSDVDGLAEGVKVAVSLEGDE